MAILTGLILALLIFFVILCLIAIHKSDPYQILKERENNAKNKSRR